MLTILQKKTIITLIFCLLNISTAQAMHLACATGDTKKVIQFIKEEYAVNAKIFSLDEQRIPQPIPTPLHYAAENGNPEIINLLLDKKADIHSTHCDFKNTPLHVSVWYNKPNATKVLIQRGAQRNKTNSLGSTPVHLAAFTNHVQCLEELLNSGDLTFNYKLCTAKNNDGNTPIHLAAMTSSMECLTILLKIIDDYAAILSECNPFLNKQTINNNY